MALKVFITGASSGIGEALAVYYADKGATLGLAARRGEFLEGLNQRLGGRHACYALDVCDAPALHAAAVDFIARCGTPDIVIANAGVSVGTLTEYEEDLAVFRRVMDTNVFGMAATFAPFIPALKAAGGESGKMRRLVGIASVAGIRGLPGAEAYSASKAAAITYLESLRLEMRPYGIKVVTICARLHRNADDRGQPLPNAIFAGGGRGCRTFRQRHRTWCDLRGDSVADGRRRESAAGPAQLAVRQTFRARAEEVARLVKIARC